MFKRLQDRWKRFEEWVDEDDVPGATPQTESPSQTPPTTQLEAQPVADDEPEPDLAEAYCYTNETTTSPYTYTPLSPTIKSAIRVLTLLPGRADADIECQLIELDLNNPWTDDDEGFEALSYVWGDITDTTPIQIDGATIQIGRSLRSALLHLRYFNKPRILWVDAVCINQEDMDERNSQVMLMGEIYSKAARTLVWLGCPCCLLSVLGRSRGVYQQGQWEKQLVAIGPLFQSIEILGTEARKLAEEGREVVPKKGEIDEDGKTTYDKIRKLDPQWNFIFRENSWWTRIWTLQEIVLAKEARLCMYDQEVDWDLLVDAMPYYSALGFNKFTVIYAGTKTNTGLEPFNMVNAMREAREPGSDLVTGDVGDEFLYYLSLSHWRDCGVAHDKIYALLGLFSQESDVGIEVDYRSDAEDVYRSATKALLQQSKSLDALGFCYPYKIPRVSGLPSWLPDWGSAGNLAMPLMNDAKGELRATHASRGLPTKLRWEDDDRTLVVDGHIIDAITKLSSIQVSPAHDDRNEGSLDHMLNDPVMHAEADKSPQTWDELDPDRPIRHLLSSWTRGAKLGASFLSKALFHVLSNIVEIRETYLEWENFARSELGENIDHRHIFRDTVTTSTACPLEPALFDARFDGWLKAVKSVEKFKKAKLDQYAKKTYLSVTGFSAIINTEDDDLPEPFTAYLSHAPRRRLGITAGKRLCLLPKMTEVGDKVVLLRGGRVPVILRQREDSSMQFVGEAYVHDAMDGEAFDEDKCVDFRLT
ncbi:uncharacterized protein QC761_0000320 [Podospora bellae-mahoneyi]|uniref:Heterokaryon incompatibility domain-containing protein n=1 Tax=Podospora bellae-mahoneyi TaxID=2093777 RepID=A0ABR0FUI6_9PEZI|nr:hypothetical protein QC761_0000320 [Podospora bellae-mahoneyi]